ncbi:MAG: aspartate kinase [Carboxydocellales bacterium]
MLAESRFIIQKFGGTSVANANLRQQVAQKVLGAKQEGYNPIVVVSAMGRSGEPYATDTLVGLTDIGSCSARELDLLMACGEIISGVVLTNTLNQLGYPAIFLTGAQAGIITDDSHGNARILEIRPQEIQRYAQEGYIVVVAGFQGISENGEITTLGRGGSDTTAAALGVAVTAEFIDIYTDVDGIMTADPQIVEDAKLLESVSYNEICQLAHEGAKVIHPRAVEIAMQKNIPLRVRSTFSDSSGTLVTVRGEAMESIRIGNYGLITGITNIPNITQLKIFTKDYPGIEDIQLKIFRAMALAEISVDFINIHPHAVIYTVKDGIADKAMQILTNMGFKVEAVSGCAKIAAVGAGMTGIPGVMSSIAEALAKEKIPILQSADSHTTIWVLVSKQDMERAVRAIHTQFKLGQ